MLPDFSRDFAAISLNPNCSGFLWVQTRVRVGLNDPRYSIDKIVTQSPGIRYDPLLCEPAYYLSVSVTALVHFVFFV